MRLRPQSRRSVHWIDVELLPPSTFIATQVQLAMVGAAERHSEFVAHFPAERAALRVFEMVRIGRAAGTDQAGLRTDKL